MPWQRWLAQCFRRRLPSPRLRFTDHARERMRGDGLTEGQVAGLLCRATSSYGGQSGRTRVYRGRIGNQPLKAVVDLHGVVVTAFVERGL